MEGERQKTFHLNKRQSVENVMYKNSPALHFLINKDSFSLVTSVFENIYIYKKKKKSLKNCLQLQSALTTDIMMLQVWEHIPKQSPSLSP